MSEDHQMDTRPVPCPDCAGTGGAFRDCPKCLGSGGVPEPVKVRVVTLNRWHFDDWHHRLTSELSYLKRYEARELLDGETHETLLIDEHGYCRGLLNEAQPVGDYYEQIVGALCLLDILRGGEMLVEA